MISILMADGIPAFVAHRSLLRVRQTVDGPFRIWTGRGPADQMVTVWETGTGADQAYAASCLAHRRGAKLLLYVGTADASSEFATQSGIAPGEVVLPHGVRNLADLGKLQDLLPDLATESYLPWPGEAGAQAMETAVPREGSPPIWTGTVARRLDCPWLGREILHRLDTGLFDRGASGMMDCAQERGLAAVAILWVSDIVRPGCERRNPGTASLALRDRALESCIADAFSAPPPGGRATGKPTTETVREMTHLE